MKKLTLLTMLLVILVIVTACAGTANDDNVASGQNKDEYFEVKVFTGNGLYSPNWPIKCYATVEYIGDEDARTVYSNDPLVGFSLLGSNFYGGYEINKVLVATEFNKRIPVRFDFKAGDNWRSSNSYSYDGKALFLAGGEYEVCATMVYYFDKSKPMDSGHIISTMATIKVQQFPAESIIAFIVVGLVFVFFPRIFRLHFKLKQFRSMRHINDYEPTVYHEPSFEDKLKAAKLQPQKIIIYGMNYFAYDNIKKKLLIQSTKARDGVLLDYSDIVSYELVKDGQTINRGGDMEGISAGAFSTSIPDQDGKLLCSDLMLVITTNKASNPEVTLQFISFSIYSDFAYKEALCAAMEAAEELKRIISGN